MSLVRMVFITLAVWERVNSSIGVCSKDLLAKWRTMWWGKEERKINICLVAEMGGSLGSSRLSRKQRVRRN